MKQTGKIIFGIVLIAAGIIWALNVLNVITFDFSLRGWWAIFVILPCLVGLFTDKDKVGPVMGIVIGVLLFLTARDVITWMMFWQLALAVMVVGFGVKLLFGKGDEMDHKKGVFNVDTIEQDGKQIKNVEFSFGKQDLSLDGVKFEGMKVKASFGTLHIDLRKAIFENDSNLMIDSSFAGIVLYLPEDLVVKTSVDCGFAGVTDNRLSKPETGSPVLFITGKAGFAGVELK